MSERLLTEEVAKKLCSLYHFHWENLNETARDRFRRDADQLIPITLKAVGERLKKALGSYFVLAYVGEDEPYAPTIEPKTVQEFVKAFERGEMPEVK